MAVIRVFPGGLVDIFRYAYLDVRRGRDAEKGSGRAVAARADGGLVCISRGGAAAARE